MNQFQEVTSMEDLIEQMENNSDALDRLEDEQTQQQPTPTTPPNTNSKQDENNVTIQRTSSNTASASIPPQTIIATLNQQTQQQQETQTSSSSQNTQTQQQSPALNKSLVKSRRISVKISKDQFAALRNRFEVLAQKRNNSLRPRRRRNVTTSGGSILLESHNSANVNNSNNNPFVQGQQQTQSPTQTQGAGEISRNPTPPLSTTPAAIAPQVSSAQSNSPSPNLATKNDSNNGNGNNSNNTSPNLSPKSNEVIVGTDGISSNNANNTNSNEVEKPVNPLMLSRGSAPAKVAVKTQASNTTAAPNSNWRFATPRDMKQHAATTTNVPDHQQQHLQTSDPKQLVKIPSAEAMNELTSENGSIISRKRAEPSDKEIKRKIDVLIGKQTTQGSTPEEEITFRKNYFERYL